MDTNQSMYSYLVKSRENNPDSLALYFEGSKITFSQLHKDILIIANALKDLGVTKGSVVTVCLPNIPNAVVVLYAVNYLGAIANMVHPLTPAAKLAEIVKETGSNWLFLVDALYIKQPKYMDIIDNCGAQILLCSLSDYLGVVKGMFYEIANQKALKVIQDKKFLIKWNQLISYQPIEEKIEVRGDQPAVYLHSGGTTAEPQTIVHSSIPFNHLASVSYDILENREVEGKGMLAALPFFHAYGLCMGLHAMLCIGGFSALVPRFSAKTVVSIMKKTNLCFMVGVPTLFNALLDYKPFANRRIEKLETLFCGGDSLPLTLKTKFDSLLKEWGSNAKLCEGYGLTEIASVCAVNSKSWDKPGSIGKTVKGVSVKVVDTETGEEVGPNQIGELCFSGPTVMLYYLNNPEGTANAFKTDSDGTVWLRTGDCGYVDEEGFIYFKQRLKRIIKVSGVGVFPSEIEDVICSVEGVKLACAIGVPHETKGRVIKAYVQLKEGVPPDSMTEKILAECRKKLFTYAIPKEIIFEKELPTTLIGKVDYRKIEAKEKEAS